MDGKRVISRVKGDGSLISLGWWLRIILPVLVLSAILLWILLVFLDEHYWIRRKNASLPVATSRDERIKTGRVRIEIDQRGQLSIIDKQTTVQALASILHKINDEHDRQIPVEIRAEAKTSWHLIEPTLGALRDVGYGCVFFLTRNDSGWPSAVEARIDPPPPDRISTIMRNGHEVRVNDRLCSVEELRTFIESLGSLDPGCKVSFVSGPNNSVQDVIEVIDICREALYRGDIHIGDGGKRINENVQPEPEGDGRPAP
jgi:biopolymer transport protein ExbD